jgi:hypothetical protein
MESARSILKKLSDELGDLAEISPQKQRRLDAVDLARSRSPLDKPDPLLFTSRPFLLCGLPLKRPPAGTMVHKRRNGAFILQVCGHPQYGLPFGQDRLIPLWVATKAVRQKSREITFSSGAEILNEFGLPPDGPHYRRLIAGFKRIFASTIFFGTDEMLEDADVWDCSRFCFFERVRLWTREPTLRSQELNAQQNSVVLSEAFWAEVQAHPIPVNREIVRALLHAPGTLDFYMWLSWRTYGVRRPVRVPLFGERGLAAQLGAGEYLRQRDFRRTVARWLTTVRHFWPDCPLEISPDGTSLCSRNISTFHQRRLTC